MAHARYARDIEATASPRARPTDARSRTPASSSLARIAIPRRSPSRPAMCLYSDGCRTPSRSASAAIVRFVHPNSSAIRSPSSTTRVCVSPALGTVAEGGEKAEDGGRGDVGLLRLRVMPGLGDDDGFAMEHLGDPGCFGLRVGKIGILVAHQHYGWRRDVAESRLSRVVARVGRAREGFGISRATQAR